MYIPGYRAWGPGRSTTIIKNYNITSGFGGGHCCHGGGMKGLGWFAGLGFLQGFFGTGQTAMPMMPFMQQPSWMPSWLPWSQQSYQYSPQLTSTTYMDNLNKLAEGRGGTVIDNGDGTYSVDFGDGKPVTGNYSEVRDALLAKSATASAKARREADDSVSDKAQAQAETNKLTQEDVITMHRQLSEETKQMLGARGFEITEDGFVFDGQSYEFSDFGKILSTLRTSSQSSPRRTVRQPEDKNPVPEQASTSGFKTQSTKDSITFTDASGKQTAKLSQSPGVFSFDARLETNGEIYKFRTKDNDHLNFGKFELTDDGIRIKIENDSDYEVTRLETRDGKNYYNVRTDMETGKLYISIGDGKEYPLEDVLKGELRLVHK